MSREQGPGLREYWAAVERGEEPDLAALVRAFPDEARKLAEADVARSHGESIVTRRLLWEVRQRVMDEAASADTLGETLKRRRLAQGLSRERLAALGRRAGHELVGVTIQNLENDRIAPSTVPPQVWRLLADTLHLDRWFLWMLIKSALSTHRAGPVFTRMERGTKPIERGTFVEEATAGLARPGVAEYLDSLKRVLESD